MVVVAVLEEAWFGEDWSFIEGHEGTGCLEDTVVEGRVAFNYRLGTEVRLVVIYGFF